ncbi:MAG: hypothetical protein QXW77_04240 [Candidatus Hadarchaeales archaeon]
MGKLVETCEACGKSASNLQRCKICGKMVCSTCFLSDINTCQGCVRKGLWIEET